jgi:hypothetical protein
VRNGRGEAFLELVHSMMRFDPKRPGLRVHYLNAEIAREWAERMGRPELAGWTVGLVEIAAGVALVEALPPGAPPALPEFGDTVDVSLGGLDEISYVAREGDYP